MFLLTRNQLLSNYQVDAAFKQLITKPEVRQVMADIRTFRNLSSDYAKIMSDLPQGLRMTTDSMIEQIATRITSERKEATQQLMSRLAQERQQLLADIADEEQRFGHYCIVIFSRSRSLTLAHQFCGQHLGAKLRKEANGKIN